MTTEEVSKVSIQKRQIKAVKWAISILLPSLLIFGFNQILISWNLDRLVSAVEVSEKTMVSYTDTAKRNRPTSEEVSNDWGMNGGDIDFVSIKDKWIRNTVVPAALIHAQRLKAERINIESLNLLTFDSGVKQARKEYLAHVQAWEKLLIQISTCKYYLCALNAHDAANLSITQTFRSSSTEFSRISPLFDFYNIGERVAKIFES
jgi:hypothetical protein